MNLGGTAKKIQRVSKVAEQSYKKINEMMERMQRLQQDLETTSDQVNEMEGELAEQRALLEAMAAQQGIDVDAVLAQADLQSTDDGETDAAEESPDSESDSAANEATQSEPTTQKASQDIEVTDESEPQDASSQ